MEPETAAVVVALWDRWVTFAEGLVAAAAAHLGAERSRALADQLRCVVDPTLAAAGEQALRAYFTEVPAHVAAVNNLDHSQLVNPLCLAPHCAVSLREVLTPFKEASVAAYGDVWLRLLDLAEAAAPNAYPNAASAREYIRMRMTDAAITATPAGVAPATQLDGILQSVFGAFPGLHDCVAQLTAAADAAGGDTTAGLGSMFDQVQQLLTGPMMQNLQQQAGAPGDRVQASIAQILEGLRGLGAALTAVSPAPTANA